MEKSTQIFTIIRYQKKVLDSAFRTGKKYYPLLLLLLSF